MKQIQNNYQLENGSRHMTAEEIRKSLNDFEYFMSNFQQITNKERNVVPFKLNAFQRMLFETLLPMVKRETRIDKRHTVVLCKPRQVGASVSVVAFINYICAFVDGMEHLNVAHVFPVGDTISKFYQQKVEPIISSVHPDIFPTIEKETLSSSILTHYKDVKGIKRDNYYELISSNASSIRSSSIHLLLEDEVGFYTRPEDLDNAIMPALPPYGFSLVVYLSTFDDKKSAYFQQKIQTAIENPDDWTLVFCPWYMVYPERSQGIDIDDVILTKEEDIYYRDNVILPALLKDNISKSRWGDCVDWYFRQKRAIPNVKNEFPTTIDEVLSAGKDEKVFSQASIDRQRKNVEVGRPMRLITDTISRRIEAQETDISPFTMFREPIYGHKYILMADPITAYNENTDYFTMMVMDKTNNEQVATFRGKEYSTEEYADFAVAMAKLYCMCPICPESNVAEAFLTAIRARGYYQFYYDNDRARRDRVPGIRTTATSKENMVDKLNLLLDNDRIILHDKAWVDELETFVKKVKIRSDGSRSVKMEAKKGKHDDTTSCLWCYAGTLDDVQLSGRKRSGYAFL